MAENNQLSDETKNNSTDTSSTDASSAVIGNHENAVVPHKISNHDKLVQTMVMVDGEWINVNDTNDQANVKYDMHKVNKKVVEAQKGIVEAKNSAESAVKYADSAVSASKVNSDAIAAQSSAIIEAKSAMDSATAEIQQLKANAASDVAQIRADVAQVQNEVDTAKAANSASVDKLKSDIGLAQKDLDNVHDSLTKAQSAVEQNQKLINDSVTKINSDIAQSRQDIITAQQANNDLTKQLDTYSKEAQEQGKTIKTIQDNQDGFSITIADVKGDVTKVSDTVDRLSAGLKDAQGNIASVKAQADQLNVTLTDHSKNINQLIATAKELSSTLKDADGRLSKVEQTASEQSTILSDLQGNLTQVRQTADSLVTTVKDAQGNIDQIKQDAKGTSEQLSNAQGDITALQKDVGGIKLTIADHDKNIHTLQADSKTLKDDMADAQGNISSLQKTSTSLVSEFRDHDGRLSKVEQTATEHTSELADTKGNLDKVTQKANALQLLLSDAQKNIQNIQLDAKGLHDTLTGQDNQLARLNVTLNNLDSKYSGITGDLQSKQTALSTEQQQTKDMLLNKADKSEVDNVKETVNHVSAEQKTMAGQISQKVSSSDYQKDKDDTITSIEKNTTAIDENSKAIKLKADATEVNNLKGTVNSHSASINLFSDQLKSMVTESKVNDIINEKGFTTQSTVQSLIDQKAGTINESITKLSNDTVTHFQSITASLDGLQTNVTNYQNDTTSKYTQLSNLMQSKVGTADFEQLKRSVDMQILDYADINNMKTNGHYFVHNLANNPIGGWVYVDVTGNANDRIRQDVYQDIGTKHAFRRWFGTYWTWWSTGAEESEITQLRNDINLRVKSGDLLSQINIAAGHTLIQSNKIYFDADSFVMSPNSKAFIPSAYITNINADKITTGTLDAAKFNVKNFSADNITSGTLNGVVVKTGANDRYFQTSKDNIYWVRKGSMSLVGNDTYLNSANGLNIADEKNIQLTTWGGATVNKDGSITNNSGSYGYPRIVIDREGKYNPDAPGGETFGGGPGDSEITQWVGNKEYTVLTRNQGFTVHLNDGNNNSKFTIQKDNKVGFYVGGGDDGNEIIIAGAGPIKLQGKYIDDGFNDGMTHTLGNLQVDNLHVRKWLGVDQSKNAIVKTSQGPVTINAYETAEYYFGDIGEGQTSADGIAYIGIEKLFNETVNTTIPYHVFITAYGPGNIWVDQREHNRFIVKSDQPNLKFSWEIKAKRKGYEHTRLQNVDDKLNRMAATS